MRNLHTSCLHSLRLNIVLQGKSVEVKSAVPRGAQQTRPTAYQGGAALARLAPALDETWLSSGHWLAGLLLLFLRPLDIPLCPCVDYAIQTTRLSSLRLAQSRQHRDFFWPAHMRQSSCVGGKHTRCAKSIGGMLLAIQSLCREFQHSEIFEPREYNRKLVTSWLDHTCWPLAHRDFSPGRISSGGSQ